MFIYKSLHFACNIVEDFSFDNNHSNIRRENRRQDQPGQIRNDVDGEYNKTVRIGLCGGNKEGRGQEIVAAIGCIRPVNEWNPTKTT